MVGDAPFYRYFDLSPIPSLFCRTDSCIIRANNAMAQLLNVPAATMAGKKLTDYLTLPFTIPFCNTPAEEAERNTTATIVTAATPKLLHLRLQFLGGDDEQVVLLTADPEAETHAHHHRPYDNTTLSLILDAVHDGVWDWNARTGAVYRSPGWLRMFGYDDHGKDVAAWTSLIHPDDFDRVMANFTAHLEQRSEIYKCEYRMRTADGQWKWTQDRGRVVERDSQGNVLRMIGSHLDTDERKRAELELANYRDSLEQIVRERTAALERAKEEAVNANRSKSDFLATISHEIRTPLNAVLGMVALLKRVQPTPEQLEFINIIDSSGEMLLTLIDDVLDLAKIEAGLLVLNEKSCDLRYEVNSVVTLMRTIAEEKSLPIKLDFRGAIPARVICDAHRLRQVLFNLIGNAIKFTHAGTVGVEVASVPAAAGKHRLTIAVSDTGIGIAPAMQQRIFEAFSQADNSINRNYGGCGLGLSVSTRLINLMGGRISVDSDPGRGSRFTIEVSLSAMPGDTTISASHPVAATASLPTSYTILAVDDDAINRLVVSRLLGDSGHTVITAAGANEAIVAVQQQSFDLILMDLHMPGINGLDAARTIRTLDQGRYRDVPIIALSANVLTDTIEQCYAAGMNGHLAKPIRIDELYILLSTLQSSRIG